GEDWTGVKLSLSTAALDRRTALPELKSLRIGRAQAAPAPSGWREPPPGLDELFEGFDALPRAEKPRPPVSRGEPEAPKRVGAAAPPAPGGAPRRRSPTGEVAQAAALPPPAPPPLPMAAPSAVSMARRAAPPQQAAPKMAKARGGALGGMFGGGGGADDLRATLDEDMPMEEAAAPAGYDGSDEVTGTHAVDLPPPPSLEPAGNLLDYDNLFMP